MRPPWSRRRTRGIPLGLLALWVAAARCLQSKYLTRRTSQVGATWRVGGITSLEGVIPRVPAGRVK